MKNLVAIILLLFAIGAYNCYAQKGQEIPLTLQYDERGNPTNPVKRAPRFRISAYLEGHTISFRNINTDYTLIIYDSFGTEVYTTELMFGVATYSLPTNLKGEYTIELRSETITYIGYMNIL